MVRRSHHISLPFKKVIKIRSLLRKIMFAHAARKVKAFLKLPVAEMDYGVAETSVTPSV